MDKKNAGSFRDPNGFVFMRDGVVLRQVNKRYIKEYDQLMAKGLYEQLTKSKTLLAHQELGLEHALEPDIAYKVIQPEQLDFFSYPYEWCFDQLKDAAILTLAIARRALEFGMVLKDASAYNIQFREGTPVFIDTLSFDLYEEDLPWVAYKQFCQHFLAPLALMVHRDVRLNQLLRIYIDGIPLDLASKLLPASTRLNLGLTTHIHLHAKSQLRYANNEIGREEISSRGRFSKTAMIGLLNNLIETVRKLNVPTIHTEWTDYYEDNNYTKESFEKKRNLVREFVLKTNPKAVWDLGANTGEFSRIASEMGIPTVAFDIDHGAVQQNYALVKRDKEKYMLPLIMDLTNPSPGLGWQNNERESMQSRGPVDLVMALALVHHLAISNNVPLEKIAEYFKSLSKQLIIEFVPKSDSQVKRLLSSREDIFPNYTLEGFETAFLKYFKIIKSQPVEGSERWLYLMHASE